MKEIQLTQGKVALVDDSDFEFLNQYNWCAIKGRTTYYAMRSQWVGVNKRKSIRMHREIMGVSDNPEVNVDHRDHDGLNNQRENIRCATNSQNKINGIKYKNSASKYKGVTWSKQSEKWRARITINNHTKHIGDFVYEIDAANAYNTKATELHGEFANLNVIK